MKPTAAESKRSSGVLGEFCFEALKLMANLQTWMLSRKDRKQDGAIVLYPSCLNSSAGNVSSSQML